MDNSIKNVVLQLLDSDGYITVNKLLIRTLGLNEAVILCELISEYNYYKSNNEIIDDEFFSTKNNLEYNTGLNGHYQRKALINLQNLCIIDIVKKGLPAKNYFKINFEKLLNILTTSHAPGEQLDVHEVHINNNKSNSLINNIKKKDKFTKCVDIINEFTNNKTLRDKLIMYLKMRLEIKDKPFYINQWRGLLNKLFNLSDNQFELETIIQQSLDRGYASFYPLKSFNIDYYRNQIISESYTNEEIEELENLAKEREKNGQRAKF